MSYAIDRRLLRLAGELLAAGSGTFGADDVRQLMKWAYLGGAGSAGEPCWSFANSWTAG